MASLSRMGGVGETAQRRLSGFVVSRLMRMSSVLRGDPTVMTETDGKATLALLTGVCLLRGR